MSETEGVWAAYAYDYGPYLMSVHPSEVEAWRATDGYGRVVFLPWGSSLTDAVKASDEAARSNPPPTSASRRVISGDQQEAK